MSSMTSLIGIRAGPDIQNLAPYHTIFHFVFAYIFLSSRPVKAYLKIDHNVSPREDVSKYGERAVANGKITQRQLNFVKRNEACHANSMEHFPLFAAAAIFATVAGVKNVQINAACATYTASRIIYAISYLAIEKNYRLSYIRSLAWWASNIACVRLLYAAGQALNATSTKQTGII